LHDDVLLSEMHVRVLKPFDRSKSGRWWQVIEDIIRSEGTASSRTDSGSLRQENCRWIRTGRQNGAESCTRVCREPSPRT